MVVRSLFSLLKLFLLHPSWLSSTGGFLVPVISSEFGVNGGGGEQNDGNGSGMSKKEWPMKHADKVDDFNGAQVCNTSQSCLVPHAKCSNGRDTDKTEKNVRALQWRPCRVSML